MSMFENIGSFFKKVMKNDQKELLAESTLSTSKDAAKERLHVVLMQDRANVSADFLELMKEEIVEVIKKYIVVDESQIDVRLTNQENEDGSIGAPLLHANIPILNIRNDIKGEYLKDGEVSKTQLDNNNINEGSIDRTQIIQLVKEEKIDSNIENNSDGNNLSNNIEEKSDTLKTTETFEKTADSLDNNNSNIVVNENNEEIQIEENKNNNQEKEINGQEANNAEVNEAGKELFNVEKVDENFNLENDTKLEDLDNKNEEKVEEVIENNENLSKTNEIESNNKLTDNTENTETNENISKEEKLNTLESEINNLEEFIDDDDDDDVTFDDLLKAAEEEERLKKIENEEKKEENSEEKKDVKKKTTTKRPSKTKKTKRK